MSKHFNDDFAYPITTPEIWILTVQWNYDAVRKPSFCVSKFYYPSEMSAMSDQDRIINEIKSEKSLFGNAIDFIAKPFKLTSRI
jgi:hypothetical protein